MNDKTYYDWLEVSPRASKEVIEKAYKALVIKYHPDLQEYNKDNAEELLKKINEAYDVLSDKDKREKYDATLKEDNASGNTISKEDFDKLKKELISLKQEKVNSNISMENLKNTNQSQINIDYLRKLAYQKQLELDRKHKEENIAKIEYNKQIEQAKKQAYHDAYIQDMRRRGYKIKYKRDFKYYLKLALILITLVFIAWILWRIPFIQKYFITFYNENFIIKALVDSFS